MKKHFFKKPQCGLRAFLLLAILLLAGVKTQAQFYSVSTNMLGLATGSFNAEGSMAINDQWSIHLPVMYNPWKFSDDVQMKHLTFLPGVRYWFGETYGGGVFLGATVIVSRFDFAGLLSSDFRYDGMLYGLGPSVGYSIPLKKRWNIEFEFGASVIWTKHDKYPCASCETKLERRSGFWLVPGKTAISLVYLF